MPDHYIDQFDTPDVWLTPVDGITVVDPNRHQSWIHEGGLETHQDIRKRDLGYDADEVRHLQKLLQTSNATDTGVGHGKLYIPSVSDVLTHRYPSRPEVVNWEGHVRSTRGEGELPIIRAMLDAQRLPEKAKDVIDKEMQEERHRWSARIHSAKLE